MKRFLAALLFFISFSLAAQETPPPTSYDPTPRYVPQKKQNSILTTAELTSSQKSKTKSKSKNKGSFNWTLDQKVRQYEKRMKAVSKKYKKEARLSKKPQYADPSYFGHKRKPKKRSIKKRKFCKECQIVH